jgi:archaellum component FlaC
MTNPIIETDIASILVQINQKLERIDNRLNGVEVGQAKLEGKVEALDEKLSGQIKAVDEKLSGQIKAVDEKLSGQIKAVDEKLSGQIKAVDEKLSGQIKALDTKVDQLDKRIGNQEFLNRGIFGGIVLIVLGGAAKLFGWVGNP